MQRIKFMDTYRLETFIQARPKMVDGIRCVQFNFSAEMKVEAAIACDPIIQRAYEDCETPERKIKRVDLGVSIENTDVDIFELSDSKSGFYRFANVTLEDLVVQRSKGKKAGTFLTFGCVLPQMRAGLWKFFGDRWFSTAFFEFTASQLAFDDPLPRLAKDVLAAVAKMVEPVADGRLESLKVSIPGTDLSFVADQSRAARIVKRARKEQGEA